MTRRHGHRPHVATWCKCETKTCFTTWEAAEAAVSRIKGAERAYRGRCCGHWHVTGYTADEFAQLMADRSVQARVEYGTVVPYDDEQGHDHEAQPQGGPDPGPGLEEPRPGGRGPRADAVERGGPPPATTCTPARLAAFLAGRGRKGQSR